MNCSVERTTIESSGFLACYHSCCNAARVSQEISTV